MKRNKPYSEEFKAEAVKLVVSKTYLQAKSHATSVCIPKRCGAGSANSHRRLLLYHPLLHQQARWRGSSGKSSNCAWSATS